MQYLRVFWGADSSALEPVWGWDVCVHWHVFFLYSRLLSVWITHVNQLRNTRKSNMPFNIWSLKKQKPWHSNIDLDIFFHLLQFSISYLLGWENKAVLHVMKCNSTFFWMAVLTAAHCHLVFALRSVNVKLTFFHAANLDGFIYGKYRRTWRVFFKIITTENIYSLFHVFISFKIFKIHKRICKSRKFPYKIL